MKGLSTGRVPEKTYLKAAVSEIDCRISKTKVALRIITFTVKVVMLNTITLRVKRKYAHLPVLSPKGYGFSHFETNALFDYGKAFNGRFLPILLNNVPPFLVEDAEFCSFSKFDAAVNYFQNLVELVERRIVSEL